jgi:hypothetical protein
MGGLLAWSEWQEWLVLLTAGQHEHIAKEHRDVNLDKDPAVVRRAGHCSATISFRRGGGS